MTFAYPIAIVILVPALPLALWALRRHDRARRVRLHSFGQPGLLARASTLPSERLTVIRQALTLAGLSLVLVAAARPQFGERPASLANTGRDLLLLLDLSRSMNAADGELPRLTLAKRAVIETVARSPGDRLGLVVFGGSAFLQLPLTADHAAFRRFLDAATTDDLADPVWDDDVIHRLHLPGSSRSPSRRRRR